MDAATVLDDVTLNSKMSLGDVLWNGVPLTLVDWTKAPKLGDELAIARAKTNRDRITACRDTARAYQGLAKALQAQGLNEHADRFAYRSQVLQREVLRRQKQWGLWLFSGLLWLLSGYGYRLWRILAAYLITVATFALAYFLLSSVSPTHLTWDHALLVSFADIHGRVGVSTVFPLYSVQQWLAACESVVGIIIEGVFIAMLIQRFFAR
jgi:hypothetical protein